MLSQLWESKSNRIVILNEILQQSEKIKCEMVCEENELS